MFKVGDIVEITTESSATGMLDFEDRKGCNILDVGFSSVGLMHIKLADESGRKFWYAASHFKLKEEAKVEKKECLFKEGQTVYCSVFGKGVVGSVSLIEDEIHVEFSGITSFNYDVGGIIYGGTSRSLFFSPPTVTGATEPVFEPVLKKGEWVVLLDNTAQAIVKVVSETSTELFYEGDGIVTFVNKDCVSVYRLGEKIEFN